MFLLEDLGFDPSVERAKMDEERGHNLEMQRKTQVQQAHMQGDIMQINTRYQGSAQVHQVRAQMKAQELQQEMQQEMQQRLQAEQLQIGRAHV